MKIRKATSKDLKRIDEIYVEGSIDESRYQFPKISLKTIKKDLENCKVSRRRAFRRYMKNKKHYWVVAEENNKIIGFGQAWIKNNNIGVTESAYIDRKFRKKGVGKKIVKEMIRWLKKLKLKHIESSCYINNKPSLKLHDSLKFKPFLIRMRLK